MTDKLIQSGSKEALQQNIKTEIKSGKEPKQAAAIAYSVQRANTDTNINDYYERNFTLQELGKFPSYSRNFMRQQKDKEVGYLMLLAHAQNMYDIADPQLKQTVKSHVNKVLQDIYNMFKLEQVKQIRDANKVLREYSKYENGNLETAQLIKHNNGYTFVASNPKDDKDSNTLQQLEQFISAKGYKPIY